MLFPHSAVLAMLIGVCTIYCVSSSAQLRSKAGRQTYSTAKQLLNNSLKHCVLFSNEHHWQTYRLRQPEETMEEWHARLEGVWPG